MTVYLGGLFYPEFQVMTSYENTPVMRAVGRANLDFLVRGGGQLKQQVLPLNEWSHMRSLRNSG